MFDGVRQCRVLRRGARFEPQEQQPDGSYVPCKLTPAGAAYTYATLDDAMSLIEYLADGAAITITEVEMP
jgi:hypothetical protein